jgi:hypothetical protein
MKLAMPAAWATTKYSCRNWLAWTAPRRIERQIIRLNPTWWNKEEQGAGADVEPGLANTKEESSASAGIQPGLQLGTKMPLITNIFECFAGPERQVSNTRRIQYCLILQPLLYLLPPLLGKPHNTLVMGRRLRRPSERSERLKLFVVPLQWNWLCQPLGQQRNKADATIGLNSAMKNRAPNNPIKPNLLEQRRAGRWCWCLIWPR